MRAEALKNMRTKVLTTKQMIAARSLITLEKKTERNLVQYSLSKWYCVIYLRFHLLLNSILKIV